MLIKLGDCENVEGGAGKHIVVGLSYRLMLISLWVLYAGDVLSLFSFLLVYCSDYLDGGGA